jgi:hypothetical protein
MTTHLQNNSACCNSIPLPEYRLLFRLHTWLANTFADWPIDLDDCPKELRDALGAIEALVEIALAREGVTYGEMLRAIHGDPVFRGGSDD